MKIEVWSDICCPFCYIGKRHLEQAINQFDHPIDIEVIWHSFELDPEAETNPDQDIYEMLADKYGQSLEWAKKANEDMKRKAAEVGIEFNPDSIIPTNSFDAHRLTKLAADYNIEDEAEEKLFEAYFTKGKNISKPEVIKQIGEDIGLEVSEVEHMLNWDNYTEEVRSDELEATNFGIRGVPFYLFNRKYAISGAQPVHTFTEALTRCYEDEKKRSEAMD